MNASTALVIVTCFALQRGLLVAGPATLPADALPPNKELPDPFSFGDGSRLRNPQDWERRRQELKELFQDYQYGHLPPKPEKLSVTRDPATEDAALGATRLPLQVMMQQGDKQVVMRVRLTLPQTRSGRLPVLVRPAFGRVPRPRATTEPATQPATQRVNPAAVFMARGYALAEFELGEIAPDGRNRSRGIYALYGSDIDCGILMAWAWGFSRTIDALTTLDEIDPEKIIANGHSRYGKAALIAGAFDERVALTAPSHSGCGGAAPYRFLYGRSEAIQNITGAFPQWFRPGFNQFVGKVDRLPIDQHELRALVAPRAQLSTEGLADDWTNPQGSQLTHLAAKRVYEFLGAGEKINIRFRPGGHIPNDGDVLDFADHIFFGKPLPAEIGQLPYPEEKAAFSWTIPGK